MKLNNQKSLRTHRKAAKLLKNMYETHLSRILEDIKEVEYCLRAKEIFVENEEEKLEYILTPEEDKYTKAANRFTTEYPKNPFK